MTKKFSAFLVIVCLLIVSGIVLADPAPAGIHPARPAAGTIRVSATGPVLHAVRGGALNAPKAVDKFYYSPITFTWEVLAGDAKYKFKSVGSKGDVIKGKIAVAECDPASCEVDVEYPKVSQKWETKVTVIDENGDKVDSFAFDPFITAAPLKTPLTSPVNGEVVSGNSINLLFQFADGARKYTVKVIDPFGGVTSGTDTVENVCADTGDCGFVYATEDQSDFASGTYTWKLTAKGDYGKSKVSTTFVVN
ncbi:MAG TPA: hypothetical protein VHL11_09945 [Phototrophicaceae bacterium]|jgi:hypothetical protein|nr:hypothetical protein [Phototrophicaceae bacterium]